MVDVSFPGLVLRRYGDLKPGAILLHGVSWYLKDAQNTMVSMIDGSRCGCSDDNPVLCPPDGNVSISWVAK